MFSLSALADTIDPVACNYKDVQKFCEKVKDPGFSFSSKKKFVAASDLEGEAVKSSVLSYEQYEHLNKLFVEMKKYATQAILQNRKESELSKEEKELLNRIQNISLSTLKGTEDKVICDKSEYFGYHPQTNHLVVCPIMAGYPDSALIWAMAAFTGRSLGQCMTSSLSGKIDPEKNYQLEKIEKKKHPFQLTCIGDKCSDSSGLMKCLKENKYTDGNGEESKNETAEKREVTEILTRSYNHPGNKAARDKMKLTEFVSNSAMRNQAQTFLTENKECFPGATNARIDVGIQDWFGSEVLARYLNDGHETIVKKPEDRYEPLAVIIDYECRFKNRDEMNQKYNAPNETRFNGGIFSNSRLRRAIGCEAPEGFPKKRDCAISTKSPEVETSPSLPPAPTAISNVQK